ncbi:AAA-domain-containing protein [Delitschia confertaspora ATCC 74209]|uniref:AAA-domain-containing protein n=1 Tax=Delitschia confertaspora ATCC 74209 TaxID=1513339 RepID=A0A9P4JP68_9PLEO|nr:AAA-domain-containing protein [Delitschia confertaspora ATCC 74209]
MQAVVWPTVRAASKSRTPARFIKGRRYPTISKPRFLHFTAWRLQTPTSSPNPDNNNPTEQNVPPVGEKDGAVEQRERGGVPEDPEALARKLQQSREMVRRYGSALKRTQRRNRTQDLPPIHIPNWFLENRVWLRENHPTATKGPMRRRDCVISISDKESGEQGALSYPFWNSERATAVLGQTVKFMLNKGLKKDEIERFVSYIKLSTAIQSEAQAKAKGGEGGDKPFTEREKAELLLNNNVSPIVLAEIRATVAAALSCVNTGSVAAFPTAKTNVILQGTTADSEQMLHMIIKTLVDDMGADLVSLDALDLAQIAGDYLGEGPEPSPNSIRSLGYETYKVERDLETSIQEMVNQEVEDKETEAQEQEENSQPAQFGIAKFPMPKIVLDVRGGSPLLKALGLGGQETQIQNIGDSHSQFAPVQTQAERLEDLKLSALLEALIDANETKRERKPTKDTSKEGIPPPTQESSPSSKEEPKFFDFSTSSSEPFRVDFESLLSENIRTRPEFEVHIGPPSHTPLLPSKPVIIRIKDIKELNATSYGSRILQKLEDIVRKRRSEGQSILILGTTSSMQLIPEMTPEGITGIQSDDSTSYSRTIVVPKTKNDEFLDAWSLVNIEEFTSTDELGISSSAKAKSIRINLRHVHDMIRNLDPGSWKKLRDPFAIRQDDAFVRILPKPFSHRVLSYDEVHRIALTAHGLHLQHPSSPHLTWAHIALAAQLLRVSDRVKYDFCWQSQAVDGHSKVEPEQISEASGDSTKTQPEASKPDKTQQNIDKIIKNATKHEKGLVRGIINPANIKTTFGHVHVPKETVEAVRTLTSLSLLRPDAFNYGVLATDKISGVLLYGPPGTGKTLLAKAVAKESGATVLEVSGSEINDKYVGEGEKNVTAIFSLARKLSPCVVFLDEADAIFGSRDGGRHRVSHRDVLNQFLKEWDGLNDLSVFVMVATNRPFDLDDAVIRRLPRRLLVDLPTEQDRKKILEIHLRDEQLDPAVDVAELAKRTPLYSGSDLKNMAVAAALACVREENEQAAIAAAKELAELSVTSPSEAPSFEPSSSVVFESLNTSRFPLPPSTTSPTSPGPILSPNIKYTFPAKRTLRPHHFEKALQEISASISEDMTSLNAIKKFDEQFGDRRGRRKRSPYGFGVAPEKDDRAARVRG